MVRQIVASIIGIVVAGITVSLVERVGHLLFPVARNGGSVADFVQITDGLPLASLLFVILAWGSGSFVGGLAAYWISQSRDWPVWVVCGFMLIGTATVLYQIPHPMWMVVTGPVVIVAGAWGAVKIGPRIRGG